MQLDDLVVEVRDSSLKRVGALRGDDLDIEVVPMFNDVGTWRVTVRNGHPLAEHLRASGSGIVVTVGDYVVMSGPSDSVLDSRSVDDDELLVVSGVSDDIYLADMLAWPQPSNGNVQTQNSHKDVRTGPCETLMHEYVKANIGPDAPAGRRVPKLYMDQDEGRGDTVTKRVRFRQLLPLLQNLGADGELGFRIYQRGDVLLFETYRQRDHADLIRLTIDNGRLVEHRIEKGAPDITRAIVAGKGKGKKRYLVMIDTDQTIEAEDEWGRRIEKFVDQRAIDKQSELTRAGKEALVEGGFTALGIQAIAAQDDGDMKFGRDWRLGDRVTIELADEERTVPVIGGILRASEDGLNFGLLLGDRHTASNIRFRPKKKRRKRNHDGGGGGGKGGGKGGKRRASPDSLDRRVSSLERHAEPRGRTGAIEMWAGAALPEDALWCDGTVYNIEDYPALFAEIGSTFGGNGTTTFGVPDMRNRLPVGVGSNYALGNTEGSAEADRSLAHQHVIGGVTTATNTSTGGSGTRVTGINANTGNTGLPRTALNFIINT